MPQVNIKGATFNFSPIRDSHNRRAQLFHNNILESLKIIGLGEDDVDINMENNCRAKAQAFAKWWFDGYALYFSYKLYDKFAENLYVVSKVIDFYTKALMNEEITLNEYHAKFLEKDDVEKQRKSARKLLGIAEDCMDLALISKNYKILARSLHPDMENGDVDRFKAVNNAHKMLIRELA